MGISKNGARFSKTVVCLVRKNNGAPKLLTTSFVPFGKFNIPNNPITPFDTLKSTSRIPLVQTLVFCSVKIGRQKFSQK